MRGRKQGVEVIPNSGSSGFRGLFDKRWFLSSFPSGSLGTREGDALRKPVRFTVKVSGSRVKENVAPPPSAVSFKHGAPGFPEVAKGTFLSS